MAVNKGERVKLIRKDLEMTGEELAAVLGIGKSALSMIETGKSSLSERNKNILVQELNVNPDWLETGRGEMFNCPKEEWQRFTRRTDNTIPDRKSVV